MRILRAASGVASRLGSNIMLRVAAVAIMVSATVWLEIQLWGWVAHVGTSSHGPCLLALVVSLGSAIMSLVAIAVMSDPPLEWTIEEMTGHAPFVMWRAMISDGRVTAWKLLLWPILIHAEVLICLWLAIGWLARLLNADLSKR